MVFNKGFMKIVAKITTANMDDCELCRNTSSIIWTVYASLVYIFNALKLFNDIGNLDLVIGLLQKYHSDEKICSNVLSILGKFIRNAKYMNVPDEYMESLFGTGILEVTGSAMKETSNESLLELCDTIFSNIRDKGETP